MATAASTYAPPPNPQLLPCPVHSCSPQHTLSTHTYRRGCKRSYLSVSGRWRVAVTQLMTTVTAPLNVEASVRNYRMPRLIVSQCYSNSFVSHYGRKKFVANFSFSVGHEIYNGCFDHSELGTKFGRCRNSINHRVFLLLGRITHGWFVQLALYAGRGDQSPRLIFHCCQPGKTFI